LDRVVVDIGREDLNRATAPGLGQSLLQQDGDRVGFLAGGAAGHPDPERVAAAQVRQHPRYHLCFERFERRCITEEPCDADQKFAE
jgi:hypothetical protein